MSTNDYWNHNTAFHSELLAGVLPGSAVLDVGCGDGLLLHRLARAGARVTGIDPDPQAAAQARARLAGVADARVLVGSFLTAQELDEERYDLITCVATLHHMPLEAALRRAQGLLKDGGSLRVVGLSANKTVGDWLISAVSLLPIRWWSRRRGESGYAGMRTAQPQESLGEIRRAAALLLPGSRVRRRFYYRYTLVWTKPEEDPAAVGG